MKIAVVTATITGRETMLGQCAYSVAHQTRRPDYHLIGNGDGRAEADVLNELLTVDCDAYIVLNDDDYLLPQYVERCVEKLRGHDVVYAWPRVEGRNISFSFDFSVWPGSLPITALIRKSLYDKLGGYTPRDRTDQWADFDFWQRAFESGARFALVPEKLWVYRFREDNMSLG